MKWSKHHHKNSRVQHYRGFDISIEGRRIALVVHARFSTSAEHYWHTWNDFDSVAAAKKFVDGWTYHEQRQLREVMRAAVNKHIRGVVKQVIREKMLQLIAN